MGYESGRPAGLREIAGGNNLSDGQVSWRDEHGHRRAIGAGEEFGDRDRDH